MLTWGFLLSLTCGIFKYNPVEFEEKRKRLSNSIDNNNLAVFLLGVGLLTYSLLFD
jgi:hypothetical protein